MGLSTWVNVKHVTPGAGPFLAKRYICNLNKKHRNFRKPGFPTAAKIKIWIRGGSRKWCKAESSFLYEIFYVSLLYNPANNH